MRRSVAIVVAVLTLATPAAARAQVPVTFSGEIRVRTELEDPGVRVATDVFTLLRTRLGVRADPSARMQAFVQVQDSRVFGEEASTLAGSAAAIDMHQGWLEIGGVTRGSRLALRAGRQEISLGNERLIGAANWTNAGRSFDGARFSATRGKDWSATALAATVEERGRRAPVVRQRSGGDHVLLAARAERGGVEGMVVHDRNAAFRSYSDVGRTTWYGRVRAHAAATIEMDLEAAWQHGEQQVAASPQVLRDQRIGAWFAGARLVRPATTERPLGLTLGIDALSGDDDPRDGSYRSFNTLYATNHIYYGLMDLLLDPAARTLDRGLVDGFASASMRVSTIATLRVDLHAYRLATGVERDLGVEWNIIAPVRVDDAAHLELGYALFRAGRAAEPLNLGSRGTIRHWSYVQLRAFF